MSLLDRIRKLEIKLVDDACPLPALVRIANTPEEEAAARTEHATRPEGTMLVLVHTVDGRKAKD